MASGIHSQMAHQAKLMPYKKLTIIFRISIRACFPSQVTRGERVSVTFNLRIFHVFRTKYRNTSRKIYKKQLNKAYYEYINNLIETPSSDQPKKFWRFVKSKRQDKIGINTLEEDNPGEKPHRIFEDLQGLSKTCQRSLKTRIFKGSLKDLLKIFKDL